MTTGQGASSSVRNGPVSSRTTLTDVNGPNATPGSEAESGSGLNRSGSSFTCA